MGVPMRRLSTVLLALLLAVAACGDDAPARDGAGAITESGDASVFALEVGDCFNDEVVPTDVVFDVPVVPCADPHDNEIYFEFSMTDAVFPGNDAALEASANRCLAEFEPFVGTDYFESELDLFPITPTAESWADGDRVVFCVVYAVDLSQMTGTMRGSRR